MKKPKLKRTCIFLSPHLDDVIFSCGSFITSLNSRGHKITVITIFTKATKRKNSKFTKKFLRGSGFRNEVLLFKERRKEDKQTLQFLGCVAKHLGFVDAAWRQKPALGRFEAILAKFFLEARFLYPRARDVFSGKIIDGESYLRKIKQELENLTKKINKYSLFVPLGIGNHVDHLITRKVGESLTDAVIYYEDFPYNYDFAKKAEKRGLVQNFVKNGEFLLVSKEKYRDVKLKVIKMYASQYRCLFFKKGVPLIPERYYQRNARLN